MGSLLSQYQNTSEIVIKPPPPPPPRIYGNLTLAASDTQQIQYSPATDAQVKSDLQPITDLYRTSIAFSPSLLAKQQTMEDIIDEQNDILKAKKVGIQEMVDSQTRMVELNNSYQKRLNQWSYVFLMIIILIISISFFLYIQNTFPILSPYIDFILASIIGLFIIYFFILINGIRSRTNVNYDEIIISPPINAENERGSSGITSISTSGIGLSSNTCVGEKCCDSNLTAWNQEVNKCISLACIKNGQLVDSSGNCISQVSCSANKNTHICGNVCIPLNQPCNTYGNTIVNGKMTESFISGSVMVGLEESYPMILTGLYTQKILKK